MWVYTCLYCAKHWFCTKRPIAYTVPCHMNVYVYINEHQNNNVQTKGEKERGMHCDDLQFLLVPIWMDDSLIIIKLNHKNKAKRKHSHKWIKNQYNQFRLGRCLECCIYFILSLVCSISSRIFMACLNSKRIHNPIKKRFDNFCWIVIHLAFLFTFECAHHDGMHVLVTV